MPSARSNKGGKPSPPDSGRVSLTGVIPSETSDRVTLGEVTN